MVRYKKKKDVVTSPSLWYIHIWIMLRGKSIEPLKTFFCHSYSSKIQKYTTDINDNLLSSKRIFFHVEAVLTFIMQKGRNKNYWGWNMNESDVTLMPAWLWNIEFPYHTLLK